MRRERRNASRPQFLEAAADDGVMLDTIGGNFTARSGVCIARRPYPDAARRWKAEAMQAAPAAQRTQKAHERLKRHARSSVLKF